MMFNRIACISCIFTFLFSACSSMDAMLNADYFPAQVGDQHNLLRTNSQGVQENFTDSIEDTSEINGTPVFVFNTRDPGGNLVRTDFYGTQSSDGVRFCGWDDFENQFSSRYNPCIFFPYIMAGETHSATVEVQGTGGLANAVTLDYVMTQQAFRTVTVPAGTFQDCGVSQVDVVNRDASGNIVEQGIATITLCPNVGLTEISHQGLSIGSATSQLVSAQIGGQVLP